MKPRALFEWSMLPRAGKWWLVWSQGQYSPGYVFPKFHGISLNAERSSAPGSEIKAFHWDIRGVDDPGFRRDIVAPLRLPPPVDPVFHGIPSNKVDLIADPEDDPDKLLDDAPPRMQFGARIKTSLPRLGRYLVRLKVENERGETSDPVVREIVLQDMLIASLGDSAASGEGNPDVPGHGDALDVLIDLPDLVDADIEPRWVDKRCHRSHFSSHSLAAQNLEALAQKTSVTFLSFACSGAQIGAGLLREYGGIERPSGAPKLPAQLLALEQTLKSPQGEMRDIDLLIINIGINDLGIGGNGFSSVIKAFADPRRDLVPDARRSVISGLAHLPIAYDEVAFARSTRFDGRVRQVLIVGYPSDVFTDTSGTRGGCGFLAGVRSDDAQFLFERGLELDEIIQRAAHRHGWLAVTGLSDVFKGHGYCSSDSWYVTLSQSVEQQLNIDGTIHPNRRGHRAIANEIVKTVRSSPAMERSPRQITVIFDKVKVVDLLPVDEGGQLAGTKATVTFNANDHVQEVEVILGEEVLLPRGQVRVRCVVGNGLAGILLVGVTCQLVPREVQNDKEENEPVPDTKFQNRILRYTEVFGPEVDFGKGNHQGNGSLPTGKLEVEYRVQVLSTDKKANILPKDLLKEQLSVT